MKVIAGRLRDEDRAKVFESHDTDRRLLVATLRARVVMDQRRQTPYEVAPMQAVGTAITWDHDTLTVGGWSFRTEIPWDEIVAVWWRDEAPSSPDVLALIEEHGAS